MSASMRNTIAVGLGGIIGALARCGISLVFNPANPAAFPWGTLLCNLAGCLLLGWLSSLAEGFLPPRVRLGLTTGVIGAFTTFSTFSMEMIGLLQSGHPFTAVLYMLVSAAGGLLLAQLGIKLGQSAPKAGGGARP